MNVPALSHRNRSGNRENKLQPNCLLHKLLDKWTELISTLPTLPIVTQEVKNADLSMNLISLSFIEKELPATTEKINFKTLNNKSIDAHRSSERFVSFQIIILIFLEPFEVK